VRILVFGNSDTRGAVASGPTWPEIARRRISDSHGTEVELIDRTFVPLGRRAPEIAEEIARETQADIVFLPLSEYTFWARTVEWRIQRRFGKRAARWFKRAEDRVYRAATKAGAPGDSAKRGLRFVTRKIIRPGALASPSQVTETYRETLARLARIEQLEVVVVAYPVTPLPALSEPRMAAARRRFISDIRAAALSRRFRWIDGDALVKSAGLAPALAYHADRVHIGDACHDLFAQAILASLPAPSQHLA
jgi:hypothetical protein